MSVRSYPQGTVAAHVLGFVNDDGQGQYGIEQFYNEKLTGKSGQQKIITDVNGIPLAINNDSVQTQPDAGSDVTLSLDIRLQRILEEKLKAGVDRTQSKHGSAIIIDPNTGQIKAMANYPTFDPSQFANQQDQSLFTNTAISIAWEPGSVMKPLMLSTALQEGSVTRSTSYFDPGYKKIADTTVTNAVNYGARTMTMDDILTKSLNTGAVHLFQSLGGGQITDGARQTWYDYITMHYMFNKPTGIELANEQPGSVIPPEDNGAGINVTYANMAFGQGLTVTPIQLAAAYSALVNGGTYYQPSIVAETKQGSAITKSEPKIVKSDVISPEVSAQVKDILRKTLEENNKPAVRAGYTLGAKSGTAEVADGNGNYREDLYNGAYIGYIEGKKLEYVMIVRLDEPKTSGFASRQAAIVWAEISNEILNSIAIEPKSP
jgi:stage V sporulation protein D (sporulation-specific penicillin-binding protein)